jgi:hypothetical protein
MLEIPGGPLLAAFAVCFFAVDVFEGDVLFSFLGGAVAH